MKPIELARDPVWRIYEGLAAEAEEKVRAYHRPARRFRASEISNCRRQIWYRLSGYVPFPKKPWLEMVGNSGDMHHDYYRHLANHYETGLSGITFGEDGQQDEAANVATEFEYDGSAFTLSCRLDGEQTLPDMPENAVLEVKTMTTYQFEAAQKAWAKDGTAGAIAWFQANKPSYLWQGNAAAMTVGKKSVYLLCIDRNLNRIGFSDRPLGGKPHTWDPLDGARAGGAVWEVEENDRLNILQKAADITKAIESGKPPTAEYVSSSTECGQCDFWIYCHGRKVGAKYPIAGVL